MYKRTQCSWFEYFSNIWSASASSFSVVHISINALSNCSELPVALLIRCPNFKTFLDFSNSEDVEKTNRENSSRPDLELSARIDLGLSGRMLKWQPRWKFWIFANFHNTNDLDKQTFFFKTLRVQYLKSLSHDWNGFFMLNSRRWSDNLGEFCWKYLIWIQFGHLS